MSVKIANALLGRSKYSSGSHYEVGGSARHAAADSQASQASVLSSDDGRHSVTSQGRHRSKPPLPSPFAAYGAGASHDTALHASLAPVLRRQGDHEIAVKALSAKLDAAIDANAALRAEVSGLKAAQEQMVHSLPGTMRSLLHEAQGAQEDRLRTMIFEMQQQLASAVQRARSPPHADPLFSSPASQPGRPPLRQQWSPPLQGASGELLRPSLGSVPALSPTGSHQHTPSQPSPCARGGPTPTTGGALGNTRKRRLDGNGAPWSTTEPACQPPSSEGGFTAEQRWQDERRGGGRRDARGGGWGRGPPEAAEEASEEVMGFDLFGDDGCAAAAEPEAPPRLPPPCAAPPHMQMGACCAAAYSPPSASPSGTSHGSPLSSPQQLPPPNGADGTAGDGRHSCSSAARRANLEVSFAASATGGSASGSKRSLAPSDSEVRDYTLGSATRGRQLDAMRQGYDDFDED